MNAPKPNRIDDLDQQIDRTLNALGKSEPKSDLHDRLLTALDQRSRVATHGVLPTGAQRSGEISGFRKWRPFAFATAALAASLAAFTLLPHSAVQKTGPIPQSTGLQARGLPGSTPPEYAPSFAPNPRGPSLPAVPSPVRVGSLPPTPTIATNDPKNRPIHVAASLEISTIASTALDQQALADFRAPSQPAPPLPPTAQERLVRLMLRQGEKVQLAKLDLARDPEIERAELTAFSNFFDPPAATPEDPVPQPEKSSPTDSDKVPQP